jgi:N-dimethylarginine dimethylaminohydrolase
MSPTVTRRYGAESMVAPLREVLMKAPGPAFERAWEDPAAGFLRPVDLPRAVREHAALAGTLSELGVDVRLLDAETASPDLVYTYDPALVTDRGAILLRSGKVGRRGEEEALGAWFAAEGIRILGRIEAPGTVDGGDVFWFRPGLACAGRTLRTNSDGIRQLAALLGGDVRVFDVPWWNGPSELVHLLSVVSPVADDLAVVYRRLLPVGLWELLEELGFRLIDVPDDEYPTLGCNVLAVRPGVVVVAEGNPRTAAALRDAGCEVHAFPAGEIGVNGGGGPTCLTRPVLRG